MTIEEEWMSRNGLKYNDSGISIKEETPISVIKWQKGEPKEYGKYLISLKNGTVESSHACQKIEGGFGFVPGGRNVIAWCKLSDIEPYKEGNNG